MSWLLFLDESGHDHRMMPYEVHGGIAIHATKLWPFIDAVMDAEQAMFGAYLHEFGSELKGEKLLKKKRFRWHAQGPNMELAERRKHALNFLNSTAQGRTARQYEFTAYAQASLAMAERVFDLLRSHDAKLFAAIIPAVPPPENIPPDFLRKDLVFLLERYFYFLDDRGEMGLLVLDGTEKTADRKLSRQMRQYFSQTQTGRQRTLRIVPAPIFVESDMAYGVQVADLCIYCINWGLRLPGMNAATRPEIEPFAQMLTPLIWKGKGDRIGKTIKSQSVTYIAEPYQIR